MLHAPAIVLHAPAIVLHATAAIIAFVVGLMIIFETVVPRQFQLARLLVVLLALMGVFLIIAILSHLTTLPTVDQIVFGVLVILLGYMIFRAVQAVNVLTNQQHVDQLLVVDHVGFVLISLFDGFAIVSALDLKAPGWLVAVIAVGAVAIGIYALTARKNALRAHAA